MDLRQLRYYKEIVEQRSISKAAEALNMAQPPLSMLLKQLEAQYGMIFIKRYREKWEVTDVGQMLYTHAVQMLEADAQFELKMHYLANGEAGQLRVGISSSCLHVVGEMIRAFTHAYPHVELQIVTGDSAQLSVMLAQDEIHVAISLTPAKTTPFASVSLPSSPFMLAVPTAWAHEQDAHTLLAQYPFISLEAMDGYSMHEAIMAHLAAMDLHLQPVMQCKDVVVTQYFVAQQIGVSIIPKVALQTEGVIFLPLHDFTLQIEPKLFYKEESMLLPICAQFIQCFQ